MTTTEPTPQPASSADDTALANALANEHAAIYSYGLVSAHSVPDNNWLVTECLVEHRQCREECIATLRGRSVTAPVAAAGYKVPFPVSTPGRRHQAGVAGRDRYRGVLACRRRAGRQRRRS